MIRIARILLSVAGQHWAMHPDTITAMLQILRLAAQGGRLSADEIADRIGHEPAAKLHPNTERSVASKPGSIALLSLRGVISNRAPMVDDLSAGGGTSCELFGQAFDSVMSNDQIKAVVIDCDSPGGSVTGVAELAGRIHSARGSKPIIGQVNGMAASAGYWLASQCDEIVLTPSSEVGSIGVYSVHEDLSAMLAEMGVKETLISAGKYKVEGNPFEPLNEEARAAIQASVDDYYALFVDDVARGRNASTKDVRNGFGQGRMLRGDAAISAGMADRIGTLSETLARFGVKPGAKASRSASIEDRPRLSVRRREIELL